MLSFEEDWRRCRALYLQHENPEGFALRDTLYSAYLHLSAGECAMGNRLIENAPYAFCPYSGLPAVQLLSGGPALSEAAGNRLLDFLEKSRKDWMAELKKRRFNSYGLLAIVSLAGCGVYLADKEAAAAAESALIELNEKSGRFDLPDEYLSPFYTALQLASAVQLRLLPVAPDIRQLAGEMERYIWKGVLRHALKGMPEPAGPYSRAYTSELAGHFQAISAVLRRLLQEDAGYTLSDTIFSDAYAEKIVPHGTIDNMRLYALYFSAFPYQCAKSDLNAWRGREYPLCLHERVHSPASRDVSISREKSDCSTPMCYKESETNLTTWLENGFSVGISEVEYENGMACSALHFLYRKNGEIKSVFFKLARDDRYIGEFNDYPQLGLRLSASNFPDDGRKTTGETKDGLLLRYTPRAFLRGAGQFKLSVIFPCHFSRPDAVRIGGEAVTKWDGEAHYALDRAVVSDAGRLFSFTPLAGKGYLKVMLRNNFLNLEWVQNEARFEDYGWTLLINAEKQTKE